MAVIRSKTIGLSVVSLLFIGCSYQYFNRKPAFATDTNLRLVEVQKSKPLILDRNFLNSQPLQDVKVCGELFKVDRDFYVRSRCKFDNVKEFYGLSKISDDALLKESQQHIWNGWSQMAQEKSNNQSSMVPFVCFIGRGNGDPCDIKNGSLVRRVRRFTSDESQFKSW